MVKKHWLVRTIIHLIDRRFAYEDAQENIDNSVGRFLSGICIC